ncbi:CBS domain-containing protein [Halarchaeum rubridurum]|uniref:CBS domain-containing protein n=1 Tax=Halarchaeum rubridurum TaxID=489911 RepID=A0A830FWZ7_9EURY|nr:CBS domain-containing protein [Halarchaeum rubridurum]MBP1953930.1 CBS domain-containing protein [Halarchaeum rubridurum]GGM55934.1 CBS domain-containing protein [Halarchaeum rubridurum]
MDISDIATQDYTEVDAEERLGKVRALFEDENPKGVIVTRAGGAEYEGVITQKQLLSSHIEDDTRAITIANPSGNAPKLERTEDVRDVARKLVEGGTKIAPVFEADQLWGIVTEDHILEAVLDSLDALTVEQIYTADVVTVNEDDTVGTVINRLREHGISRLPVLDEDGDLTGVVTTYDLVRFVTRDIEKTTRGDRRGEVERMLDLPVSDVMSEPVETIRPDDSVESAVRTMLENDYAGLVVTTENEPDTVAGVLTKTDVLRALSYTEEEHMDVQITNIDLLDTLVREDVREGIEEVTEKYSKLHVRHAHVRFHEHKERLRGTPLIQCQIRLRTNQGQIAGTGEGYGADNAYYMALDTLERNVLEVKGVQADEEYQGQLLRKLGEL